MTPAGYSGTPLPKKLGIRRDARVALVDAPEDVPGTLGTLPDGAELVAGLPGSGRSFDVVLLFARERDRLEARLAEVIPRLDPDGGLWTCWPKKSSPLAGRLTKTDVQRAGLDTGLVDNKVCAVDDDWSGLRFVFRKEDRSALRKG